MKKRLLLIVYCLSSTGLVSCSKWYNKPQVMPAATSTGANTFGCYIDGRLFLPVAATAWGSVPPVLGAKRTWYGLSLNVYNRKTNKHVMFLIPAPKGTGNNAIHFIGDTTGVYAQYATTDSVTGDRNEFVTSSYGCGSLLLTRYNDSIVAGTFWFDAVDTIAHDTVHVRDGRFDVKF